VGAGTIRAHLEDFMKISSRLLLVLLPTVVGIMAAYSTWAVRQREALALAQTEAEARVFSTAVGVAFAHAFRDLQLQDVREILQQIDDNPGIYGVVFYDPDGSVSLSSTGLDPGNLAPVDLVRSSLMGDSVIVLDQLVSGERVQSVLRTVRDREGAAIGVLEVVQPLAFVEGDRAITTRRFLLNTATLLLVLSVLLVVLVRRYVARPVEAFISAIHRLGDGQLPQPLEGGKWTGELEEAAREFDRMVARLGAARAELEREVTERIALQERVRETAHLAAIGTLAAGVAHQIATPLSVIGGRADNLLRRAGRAPEDARSLDIIRKQSLRISRIVRSLLHFARRPQPEMRDMDAIPTVDRALELFAGDLDELGVELERAYHGNEWVRSDPDLLEEVLVTVLDNAVHALREPGASPRLAVRVWSSRGDTTIEVRDGGKGIADAVLPHVFEPFYTTRSGGTGLGLPVSKSIVEQLDGRLEVEGGALRDDGADKRPRGAAVRIILPALDS
jgi:signal transduction histidine kinase